MDTTFNHFDINPDISADIYGVRPAGASGAYLISTPYLDAGRIALRCLSGSDELVAQIARQSYTSGTRRSDKDLLHYLMRHRHTSPFEHASVTFQLRIPIFIARQLLRHRTASVNELSGRYSVIPSDAYLPEPDRIRQQSTTNKQGSGDAFPSEEAETLRRDMEVSTQSAIATYALLIEEGVARETARMVLPQSTYTELAWTIDLHNFLHFLKLRTASYAQYEMRILAELMYLMVAPKFPMIFQAWNRCVKDAVTFTSDQLALLGEMLYNVPIPSCPGTMGTREYNEFVSAIRGTYE